MSAAAQDVLAERARQINEKGWLPGQDDTYRKHELAHAAACYAYPELTAVNGLKVWPWSESQFKVRDARQNYVRAAALLLAEIERLDREEALRERQKSKAPETSEAMPTALQHSLVSFYCSKHLVPSHHESTLRYKLAEVHNQLVALLKSRQGMDPAELCKQHVRHLAEQSMVDGSRTMMSDLLNWLSSQDSFIEQAILTPTTSR